MDFPKEVNFLICETSEVRGLKPILGMVFGDEDYTIISPFKVDMLDLLVFGGFFQDRGVAFKEWKGNIFIPYGISEYKDVKLKRNLFVFRPAPDNWNGF